MRCPPRYHQREAKAKEEVITRQGKAIVELQAELSANIKWGRTMEEEVLQLRSSAAHDRERLMGEESPELISGLSVAHARENEAAHKEIARLTSELDDVEQLLVEERNATAAAIKVVEAVEAVNSKIRSEADASRQTALKEGMELRSALSAALKEEAATTSQLADVENLDVVAASSLSVTESSERSSMLSVKAACWETSASEQMLAFAASAASTALTAAAVALRSSAKSCLTSASSEVKLPTAFAAASFSRACATDSPEMSSADSSPIKRSLSWAADRSERSCITSIARPHLMFADSSAWSSIIASPGAY